MDLLKKSIRLAAISAFLISLGALPGCYNNVRSPGPTNGFTTFQLDSDDYQLALWGKILQPAAIGALVLVAISFIFGPLREGTMGFRIFAGVIVGIVFRTSQDLLAPASLVFGFAPIYAALVPILLCVAAGMLLLLRAR